MKDFSIGGVITDTIARIRAGFLNHYVYALIPTVLAAVFGYFVRPQVQVITTGNPMARLMIYGSPLYWLVVLVGVLCSAWATTGVIGSMLERPPLGFSQMIPISTQNMLKYVVLYVIWYILLVIGMILLFVPGLIVLTMFAVAIPAMVDRRLGPIDALKESRRLTKGRRLAVFGALVLFVVILAVPSLLALSVVGFNVTSLTTMREEMPLLTLGLSAIVGPLYVVLTSALLTALYAQLGGASRSAIVETFG